MNQSLPLNSAFSIDASTARVIWASHIVDGPENVPDTSLTWNLLEDASTYTIPSTFDANGDLDYEWYNGTAAIGDILSTSQTYTLMKAEYAHVSDEGYSN